MREWQLYNWPDIKSPRARSFNWKLPGELELRLSLTHYPRSNGGIQFEMARIVDDAALAVLPPRASAAGRIDVFWEGNLLELETLCQESTLPLPILHERAWIFIHSTPYRKFSL